MLACALTVTSCDPPEGPHAHPVSSAEPGETGEAATGGPAPVEPGSDTSSTGLLDGSSSDGTSGGGTSDGTTDEGSSSETGPAACMVSGEGLSWPLDCTPEHECWAGIGYPDVDGDGVAFDCGPPGYAGHQGTDIGVTESAMLEGVTVFAAAAAEVVFVRDDKHDRCDLHPDHPDCLAPPPGWWVPGESNGYRVCTEGSPELCNADSPYAWCFWCFDGGNVVILRHLDGGDVFATRYDHLRMDSAMVEEGDLVAAGDPIALVGSAGHSTGPHLHFEVWDQGGWYSLTEPWSGPCSPAGASGQLFAADPAWCS